MKKHKHCKCKHKLVHCEICDAVYCEKCEQEWRPDTYCLGYLEHPEDYWIYSGNHTIHTHH